MALVLYSTLVPASALPNVLVDDKLAHGMAFLVLMSWFCGVFEMRFSPLVAGALLCLGILIELAQSKLAYRSAELADGLADLAGVGLGWTLAASGLQRWAEWVESQFTANRS